MELYKNEGWLNLGQIIDKHPKVCIFCIVGARQTGKTYAAFDYFHENNIPYFLLRRKEDELNMVLSNKGTSYWSANFEWAIDTRVEKITNGVYACYETQESNKPFCFASYLSKAGSIRGFANHDIEWIVFDEFIGKDIEPMRKGEDTALLDIYDTINANRELEGKPPLKILMMANSNDIYSPILETMNFRELFINMNLARKEFLYIPQRQLVLINLAKSPISAQRANNAIYRAIGGENSYTKMALENAFEWLDDSAVHNRNMSYYQPLFAVDDVTFWRLKTDTRDKAKEQGYTNCYVTDGVNRSVKTVLNSKAHNAKAAIWSCLRLVVPPNPLDDIDISYATPKAKIAAYKICEIK